MTKSITLLTVLLLPVVARAQVNHCTPVARQQIVSVPVATTATVTPSIFVFNAVPSVPQGNTGYVGQATVSAISSIDIDRLARQAGELQKAAAASQAQYLGLLSSIVAAQRAVATGQQSPEHVDQPKPAVAQKTLLAETCYNCHNGSASKGGFRLDQTFDPTRAMAQVIQRNMPPDGMPDERRLALLQELLALAKKGSQ